MDETQTPPMAQPVSGTQSIGEIPVQPDQPDKKRRLLILGALLAFVILPLLIFGAWRLFGPKPDVLLATVGDQKIYKSDVIKAAEEQYLPLSKNVLQTKLNNIIEHKILEIESKKLSIQITEADVNTYIQKTQKPTDKDASIFFKKQVKYWLLKKAISDRQTETREVDIIGYWIPPRSDPRSNADPNYAQKETDGKKALDEAEIQMKNNESLFKITQSLASKYPILKDRFTINGILFNTIKNPDIVIEPIKYSYKEDLNYITYYNIIFGLKVNAVKKFISEKGSGGSVVKIISIHHGSFNNYNEWLRIKKQELVNKKSDL